MNFAAKYNWEISFLLLKNYKMQQVNSVVLNFVKSVVGVSNVCERSAVLQGQ